MNIKHWEQYLSPLDKTQLNVYPAFFTNLLKYNRILLPIFQRKYCWTLKQLSRYWYDLLYIALGIGNLGHRKHARSHDNSHTLGKIVTFEEFEQKQSNSQKIATITIIDGQQRLTTTLIILISIRTALSKMKKQSPVINKINSILFRKSVPKRYNSNLDNIKYNEGDSLHFIRFLPTYLDRSSFYDLIFDRMPSENSNQNPIYFAKRFFDRELLKYNNYEKIIRIYKKLLTKFKFIYVGIPQTEKTDVQHCIYQWFFERELYIEQGGGDRPGYTQTVCDLFRNYALSFFMNEPMKQQKKIYKLWLGVEQSYHDINELNKYIISLIDTKELSNYHVGANYDVYRGLVGFIELKLKKYKKKQYKLFVKEFIINLQYKAKNMQCNGILIYGYIRCMEKRYGLWNLVNIGEAVYMIDRYLGKEENVKSLVDMETKINRKLSIKD